MQTATAQELNEYPAIIDRNIGAMPQRRLPTEAEIQGYFNGMRHALKICKTSRRGKMAAQAIKKELTTYYLLNEQRIKQKSDFQELVENAANATADFIQSRTAKIKHFVLSPNMAFALCGVALCFVFVMMAFDTVARQQNYNHNVFCRDNGNEANYRALMTGQEQPCK